MRRRVSRHFHAIPTARSAHRARGLPTLHATRSRSRRAVTSRSDGGGGGDRRLRRIGFLRQVRECGDGHTRDTLRADERADLGGGCLWAPRRPLPTASPAGPNAEAPCTIATESHGSTSAAVA